MSDDLTLLKSEIKNRVIFTDADRKIITSSGGQGQWVFDFRSVLLDPSFLKLLTDILWAKLEPLYPFQIGGEETAAIPIIAALVLKSLEKQRPVNGFYIRKSRKKHDLQEQIEGTLTEDPVVLIDDLINSGTTAQHQILLLEQLGKKVCAFFAVVQFREESAYSFLQERSILLSTLFTLSDFGLSLSNGPAGLPSPQSWYKVVWYGKSSNPTFTYSVPKSAPALDKKNIYFGTDGGLFWALSQETGNEVWRFKVGLPALGKSIFSSPALYKETVYFGAYDGNVYALDTQTGKARWTFAEADWVGSSPALAPDLNLLFIGLEFGLIGKRGGIVALNLYSGKKEWSYTIPDFVHSFPGYSSRYQVVGIGSNNNVFYLFDAKKGRLMWEYKTQGEIKGSCVFDEKRGLVFFGSFDGNLYSLDIKSGTVKFIYDIGTGIFSTPLLDENSVYVASLDKRLYAINIDTQQLKWITTTSGRIVSTPVFIEENIFLGSNDGRVYEIDPQNGKIISFFQTTERVVNKIVYNENTKHFFIPTFANEIYCVQRNFLKSA